jgi:hypothetical protein
VANKKDFDVAEEMLRTKLEGMRIPYLAIVPVKGRLWLTVSETVDTRALPRTSGGYPIVLVTV